MRQLEHRPFAVLTPLVAGAVTAVLAAACVPLPGNRQLARETVARKESENTLVSDRGGACRVKADVFEKINVGDEHTCAWKYADTNASPVGGATGPVQDQAPRRAPGRPGGP